MTALPVRSFKPFLTDSGRALSSHPLETNDCSVRAISNLTGLSYDEAWDELVGAGRDPLDGFDWQEWCRKAGVIQAPWTGKPHWYLRYVSFEPRKGCKRIKARDLPSLLGHRGAWAVTSLGHVEAWVNGIHYDSPTAVQTLFPSRVVFGAWECRRVARDQRIYMAWRCYYMDGAVPPDYDPEDKTVHAGRPCYRSALGPIAATSHHEAYQLAEKWYGHKIGMRNSDLLVTGS